MNSEFREPAILSLQIGKRLVLMPFLKANESRLEICLLLPALFRTRINVIMGDIRRALHANTPGKAGKTTHEILEKCNATWGLIDLTLKTLRYFPFRSFSKGLWMQLIPTEQ